MIEWESRRVEKRDLVEGHFFESNRSVGPSGTLYTSNRKLVTFRPRVQSPVMQGDSKRTWFVVFFRWTGRESLESREIVPDSKRYLSRKMSRMPLPVFSQPSHCAPLFDPSTVMRDEKVDTEGLRKLTAECVVAESPLMANMISKPFAHQSCSFPSECHTKEENILKSECK